MEGSNTIEARFVRGDNRWTMAPENGGDSSLPSGPGPEGMHWGCDPNHTETRVVGRSTTKQMGSYDKTETVTVLGVCGWRR
jgi:hypothetical protein